MHPDPHSFKLMASFFIVVVCMYAFYIHTLLNIDLGVHMCVCMFSELTIWHGTTNWCALPSLTPRYT